MNKLEVIQEIKNLNKKDYYLAGDKVRRLPVHKGSMINEGIPRHKLPIVYTKYWYTTDLKTLTSRTRYNVFRLQYLYGIDWFFVVKYEVEKEYDAQPQRHAWMIYGDWNGKLVNMYRKETKNISAGTTNMYFGRGYQIQVHRMVAQQLKQPFESQDEKYIRAVRRLNRLVSHPELEKIILLNT